MITHFRQAIEETLPWLSSFGADPTGGMIRLLYSPEWLETQQQFKKRMAASGLETRFDEVGNLYGRLGNDSNLLIVFYVQIMPDDLVM
ncbi:hypothetical protein SND77_03230, partial [Escherichia coli]|nr:hypothetical protein [Escherichia coli]